MTINQTQNLIMAAVVRVKRFLDDPPADALILNCKRQKLSNCDAETDNEELSAVLKFAGTIENQEDIFERINKSTKVQFEEEYKKHITNVTAKLREQAQATSKNNRYKVINCFRSIDPLAQETDDENTNKNNSYTVYDIESDTKEKSIDDKQPQYVYDLYYTSSDYLDDDYLNEFVSIYPLSNDLIYGSLRDNGYNAAESDEDSDDSNAENNWRNDYPNESDVESITEDDMLTAVKRCNLDDDSLSSEDDIGYNNEKAEKNHFDYADDWSDHDIDDNDTERFGEQYAKFKAKVNNMYNSRSDNSNLCYYDDDDDGATNDYY